MNGLILDMEHGVGILIMLLYIPSSNTVLNVPNHLNLHSGYGGYGDSAIPLTAEKAVDALIDAERKEKSSTTFMLMSEKR
jgi:hypothetical protein